LNFNGATCIIKKSVSIALGGAEGIEAVLSMDKE
jgi:hypothetical protein